jgi:hypothetical protein
VSIERREFLQGGALLALCGAVWVSVRRGQQAVPDGAPAPVTDPLLDRICDLLIPMTDTPGALAAGVPAFVLLALQHQLAGATPADRTRLAAELDARAGQSFLRLGAQQQHAVLAALDQSQFAPPAGSQPVASAWPRIKKLIVMGYYTSDAGASQELRYQLVPGRYDPDLTVKPGERASANDWVGQQF